MHKLLLALFLLSTGTAWSQSVNAPLNDDYYHLVDRYEILSGEFSPYFFTSWKPYTRQSIALFADSLSRQNAYDERVDRFNLSYLKNDNWEFLEGTDYQSDHPVWDLFYRSKSDLYHAKTSTFDLHINPVLQLSAGTASDTDDTPFINTRGFQVRGMIDGRVGFYTYVGESQVLYPGYVRQYIDENLVIPREGFWKGFKENGVDFLTARGYISFQATRHINVQFGHDQFRMGNGYRSMILSDFAPPSLFLKVDAQIWKMKYTFMVRELTADIYGNRDGLTGSSEYPNKFHAFHQVQINFGKKFNLGVFESVIYSNPDPLQNARFEWKYLNPVIFYRTIEQQDGSTDNVILGLDSRWLVTKGLALYGQFTLDELVFENLKDGNGWWGNKFGFQLGGEWVNAFGLSHLDLQLEGNLARPYTYTHNSVYGGYSQYRQPLAHPLGANFREVLGILRFQPIGKLTLTGKLMFSEYGLDTENSNWGKNILLSNTTHEMNYGNEIGQGTATRQVYGSAAISYMWKHDFYLDLQQVVRKVESDDNDFNINTSFTSLGIRWNIPARLSEF